MKHTPAPWNISKRITSYSIWANGDGEIARCFESLSGNEKENAKLIAAAPDLLEACKNIAEIIDYEGEINNSAIAVIKELKEAIQKAE